MKTFEVFLKGRANALEIKADKAEFSGGFLKFTKGSEIIAEFVISETLGFRES